MGSYDIGFKKIEKKLISLKQRLDEGKKLSSKEVNLLNGMDEVEIDRKKNSGERSGVIGFDFLDEYHVLVEEQKDEREKKVDAAGYPNNDDEDRNSRDHRKWE